MSVYVNVASSLKQTVGTTTSCKHCNHCTGTTWLFGLCTLQHVQLSRSIGLQGGARGVTYVCIVLVKDSHTQHLVIVLGLAWLARGGVYHSINNVVGEIIGHDHKLWHKL